MIKKTFLALGILLILAFSSIVFGDDATVSAETEVQAEIITPTATVGIETRAYVLSKTLISNIDRSLIGMDSVIERLSQRELNTSDLESYQERLEALQATITPEETTPQEFRELRMQASSIVTDFRQKAAELTSEQERAEMRANIQARIEANQEMRERMRQAQEERRAYNERKLQALEQRVRQEVSKDIDFDDIMRVIQESNLTREQVRELQAKITAEVSARIPPQATDRVREVEQRTAERGNEADQLRRLYEEGEITREELNRRMNQLEQNQKPVIDSEVIDQVQVEVTAEIEKLQRLLRAGEISEAEFEKQILQIRQRMVKQVTGRDDLDEVVEKVSAEVDANIRADANVKSETQKREADKEEQR